MFYRIAKSSSITLAFISIFLLLYSLYLELSLLLIFSIILLVVSIFLLLFTLSFEIFSRDRVLDLEELEKQGLTIIMCNNCHKNNVKEDIYCIYCGEKLGISNEKL